MSKKSKPKVTPVIAPDWTLPNYLMDLGWDISATTGDLEVTAASALSHTDFPGIAILHSEISENVDDPLQILMAKIYKQAVAYGRIQGGSEMAAKMLLKNQPELDI